MACDESGCMSKGLCTSIGSADLLLQNVQYPSSANPGDYITITADIYNNFYAAGVARLCIYDRDTNQCIASAQPVNIAPYTSYTFSLAVQMPNHNFDIQIAPVQTRIPYVSYDCGQYQNITITPINPPGTTYGCSPTGYCEPGYGSFPDSTCAGTCVASGGGGGCNPACSSNDMCVLGTCIPKPLILVGILALAVMSMKGG